jgi:transmembrane sensor
MNSQILDEACEWFVDFRAGDIDANQRQRFDDWVRRSPEHIRAYIDIARIYVEVPPPDPTGEIDVPGLIAYANRDGSNVAPLPSSIAAREATRFELEALKEQHPSAQREPFWMRHRALAASLITGLIVASGLFVWRTERYPSYSTDIGEHRSIALTDGSTVDLNARSTLRVAFSAGERLVELLEGQALFQVAKDKSRPFIVKSGDATVRAVGTQFDVDRKATGTTVTVLEGRVVVYSDARAGSSVTTTPASTTMSGATPRTPAVAKAQKSPVVVGAPPDLPPALAPPDESGNGVYVGAGQQVTVTSQALAQPERADVTAATAWMQRRLIFDSTKLSDVVEQFNRNNRRQLIIESASLAGYHVSGTYSSTDPSSLVRFLREQPGFKITETDTEVRIASK